MGCSSQHIDEVLIIFLEVASKNLKLKKVSLNYDAPFNAVRCQCI